MKSTTEYHAEPSLSKMVSWANLYFRHPPLPAPCLYCPNQLLLSISWRLGARLRWAPLLLPGTALLWAQAAHVCACVCAHVVPPNHITHPLRPTLYISQMTPPISLLLSRVFPVPTSPMWSGTQSPISQLTGIKIPTGSHLQPLWHIHDILLRYYNMNKIPHKFPVKVNWVT